MPYILDKAATRDLERWLLQATKPSVCSNGVYRFAASQVPDSVWEACDFREIKAVDLVLGDGEDEDFIEVIAPDSETIEHIGAESWLLPHISTDALKKLRTSLAI